MPFLFRLLAARWMKNRLLGRGGRGGYGYGRGGYGRGGYSRGGYGYGGPLMARRGSGRAGRRGRAGLFGPFPYYSTRTRGGSRVTVGGCCLPLALGMFAVPVMALRMLVRRWH